MASKIVVMEPHEWLEEAAATRSFAFAEEQLQQRSPRGVEFDANPPVAIAGNYVLTAEIDEDAEAEFLDRNPDALTLQNLEISTFPVVNPGNKSVGTIQDVGRRVEAASLAAGGMKGRGVRVCVVDTGIDGKQVNVSGGWSPWPGIAPGTSEPGHGTMCAIDVLVAAPEAQIHDYPLLRTKASGGWVGRLGDAIRFYAEILAFLLSNPGPLVVSNSWGIWNEDDDAPRGSPQNYSVNPAHPFNQVTGALIGAGADVIFAAGNCGKSASLEPCGNSVGPGNSIHGANSHPEVVTVGAVTVNDDLLGYSSQGPGGLAGNKPDLCAFSHFEAAGFVPSLHSGTSAACPVVSGVVAAIRSHSNGPSMKPHEVKAKLVSTATPVGQVPNNDYGHGILNVAGVLATI